MAAWVGTPYLRHPTGDAPSEMDGAAPMSQGAAAEAGVDTSRPEGTYGPVAPRDGEAELCPRWCPAVSRWNGRTKTRAFALLIAPPLAIFFWWMFRKIHPN